MAFNGHYRQTIDARNQIELPESIRQVIDSNQYVITRGAEICLLLYSIEQWREMKEEVAQLNDTSREVRYFYRRMMMWGLYSRRTLESWPV